MNKLISCGVLAVCIFLISGCGSGGGTVGSGGGGGGVGTAPTIANLRYSPTSANRNDGGGLIPVSMMIDVSDPDGDVSTLVVKVFNASGQILFSKIAPAGADGKNSGLITASVTLPTTSLENLAFQVSIFDVRGHASNTLSGSFSVVEAVPAPPAFTLQGEEARDGTSPSGNCNGTPPLSIDDIVRKPLLNGELPP